MTVVERMWKGIASGDLTSLPLTGTHAETWGHGRAHHGAFYFYLLAIPALVSGFHPYGPALFAIMLNIAAILLMFLVGKEMKDEYAGLIAAYLLSISGFAVMYSRWWWNPNIVIFLLLVVFYAVLKVSKGQEKFWPLLAFAVSAATQPHTIGYIFLPLTLGVLLCARPVSYPKGRILWATIVFFFVPLIPELIAEFSSGFSLVRQALGFLAALIASWGSDANSLAGISHIGNLALYYLTGFVPARASVILVWSFLAALIIWGVFVLAKFSRLSEAGTAKTGTGVLFSVFKLRYAAFFFYYGVVPAVAVAFLSRYHLVERNGSPHFFVFIIPCFLLFCGLLFRSLLARFWLFPFGVMAIMVFSFYSVEFIQAQVFNAPLATFHDQVAMVRYLDEHSGGKPYSLEIRYRQMADSVKWIYGKSDVLPPAQINGESFPQETRTATLRYTVVNRMDAVNQQDQHYNACVANAARAVFGVLEVYQCPAAAL